jgi:hypothetical protein
MADDLLEVVEVKSRSGCMVDRMVICMIMIYRRRLTENGPDAASRNRQRQIHSPARPLPRLS